MMPTSDIAATRTPNPTSFKSCQPAASLNFYSGICNGTLGELLQGPLLQDGKPQIAIISLPIRRYSWVHYLCGCSGDHNDELGKRPKCRKAI